MNGTAVQHQLREKIAGPEGTVVYLAERVDRSGIPPFGGPPYTVALFLEDASELGPALARQQYDQPVEARNIAWACAGQRTKDRAVEFLTDPPKPERIE